MLEVVRTVSSVSPVFSTINSRIYSTGVPSGSELLVQKIPVWPPALSPSIVKTVSSAGPISATGSGGTLNASPMKTV